MAGWPRVLCIGLDAGDRTTALDLVAHGRMPNVAAFLERGSRADVESPFGTFVGSVWPTFATSRGLARHGRYCYEQLVPGTYEVHRVPGGTADPFWAAISAAGKRVAVVDLPHADIVSSVDALQVVDWGRHDPNVGFRTHPSELGPSIIERYGRQTTDSDEYARRGELPQLRDDLLDGLGRKADFVVDLVGSERWDLFLVVFSESHCGGHLFWSVHDPRHPAHDPDLAAQLGDPVEELLTAQDAAIGRLVEAAGDDVVVLVLLSHGMTSHFDATQMLPKMLAAIEDAEGAPRTITSVRARAVRGIRRGRRTIARGDNGASRFIKSVDGSRRFFAIPNNDAYGAIRLNVVGREPAGRVKRGADYEATCALIEERLTEWVNANTGTPVVARVVRAADHYPESTSCALPDLFVEWERSEPITAVEAPGLGRVAGSSIVRTGDHIPGGLLVAVGDGIASATHLAPIHMEDIGATISAILDIELSNVDGNVLDELVPR